MHSTRCILIAGLALLMLSACESQTYRDGYTAGEKDGREAGERSGYIRGYASGTVKVVGDDWLPSLGLGICGGIGLLGAGITTRLLWDSFGGLMHGGHRLSVLISQWVDAWWFHRSYAAQVDLMRQRERAEAEARARIQATQLLRAAHRTLSDEEIRLQVEQLIRSTHLVRDMQDNIEVTVAACETALGYIHTHPDLSAEQKGKLLRHLAEALPIAP